MTDTEAAETIHVVSSGDLRVHIRSEDDGTLLKDFVVSCAALRLASPVWNTMLDPHGHFTESRGGELSLTDDDPTAFLILMRVAHMQFNQLDVAISYETLLSLARICDKYDTVTLIRPWVDQWLEPYASQAPSKSYHGFEGLAFIAWTIGKPELFWNAVNSLVANITFDINGNMMHRGELVGSIMPPGLLGKLWPFYAHVQLLEEWLNKVNAETIKTFRDEKLTTIINLCLPLVNQYMALVGTGFRPRHRCQDGGYENRRRECDSLNFGNLVMQLTGLGLWPDQDTARISKSLNVLMSGLLAIPELYLSSAHTQCGFYRPLKDDIRKIADLRLPTDSLPECEEHMAMQKAKRWTLYPDNVV